jgi:peptide/nickel transport system permease protein
VGDLGRSIRSQLPVSQEILDRAPSTFELATAAMVISILIGAPIGILSALKRGSVLDKSSMVAALTGVSIPHFWLGLVLMYAFAVRLNWFPVLGLGGGMGLVLPAVTLGIGEAGVIARLVRSSMLEVLGEDYLITARAKGLPERVVILRHALKNALIPVITILGMEVGYLLAGSMIVEVVFGRPGIGTLAVSAILDRDFPVVQGTVFFTAVVFVSVNTLVDLLYAVLDPRISYT